MLSHPPISQDLPCTLSGERRSEQGLCTCFQLHFFNSEMELCECTCTFSDYSFIYTYIKLVYNTGHMAAVFEYEIN
jgi:hypothetical protein